MSVNHRHYIGCHHCNATVGVQVFHSLNVQRHPEYRDELLNRTLHVFTCQSCGNDIVLEVRLLYFDPERRFFFGMYPMHERASERDIDAHLDGAFNFTLHENAPPTVSQAADEYRVRTCFGYEELREKVVCFEAGLDDVALEALKCEIVLAHPWFRENGVATLRLDSITDDGALFFSPDWVDAPPEEADYQMIRVEREHYDAVEARRDEILESRPELVEGHHVSMLRHVEWPAGNPNHIEEREPDPSLDAAEEGDEGGEGEGMDA